MSLYKLPDHWTEEVHNDFASKLGIKTIAGKEVLKLALENAILMDKKQQDYGSKNITRFGIFGVLVRISDKDARITNLQTKGLTKEEAIQTQKAIRVTRELAKNEFKFNFLEAVNQVNTHVTKVIDYLKRRKAKASVNESIIDTFRDLANYCFIAVLVLTRKWPEE